MVCGMKPEKYAAEISAPVRQKIIHWIFDNLMWDTAGTARTGFRRGLWATRKRLIALAGSAVLTWREWVEHRPPESAIVALIHFVFVLAAIALLDYAGQRLTEVRHGMVAKQPNPFRIASGDGRVCATF